MTLNTKFRLTAVLLTACLILSCAVSVTNGAASVIAAGKIRLNKKSIKLECGDTFKLKLKGTKNKVAWSSANKKIAKVSKKGKVTAKKAGKTKITAKSGGKKYKCSVKVINHKISNTSTSVHNETNIQIQPTVVPDDNSGIHDTTPPSVSDTPVKPTESQAPTETPSVTGTPEPGNTPNVTNIPDVTQTPEPGGHTPEWDYDINSDGSTVTIVSYKGKSKDVIIPDEIDSHKVTEIDSIAFSGRENITSVSIPDSVTYIGENAFLLCTGLTEINVADGNTAYYSEEGNLYEASHKLLQYAVGKTEKEFKVPDNVTSIGSSAFACCTNLETVIIGGSVTEIEESTFEGCTNLTSVSISNGVITIGREIFSGCKRLGAISIPGSVETIGSRAFIGCTSLKEINVDAENANYHSTDGSLYDKTDKLIQYVPGKSDTVFLTPDGTTAIGDYAFEGSQNLTRISVPTGVKSIGAGAFRDCSNLSSVNVPNGVTVIGESAFYGCNKLKNISLPAGVARIEMSTFWNCSSLERIELPKGLIAIGAMAFWNCGSLTEITLPDSITDIEAFAFSDCSRLTTIKGKAGSYAEKYAKDNGYRFETAMD